MKTEVEKVLENVTADDLNQLVESLQRLALFLEKTELRKALIRRLSKKLWPSISGER